MSHACIYFKSTKDESSLEIQKKIDSIIKTYRFEYEFVKILVETDEFSQLDIFLNREIDKFDCLILCKPIKDEFYELVLNELQRQNQLKIIQVD